MPKQLKYVAQETEDMFYQNYKADSDFFVKEDFVFYTGNTITGIYQAYYQEKYKELLSEKKDEVISFDIGMLSEQVLEVSNDCGFLSAKLKYPIMTFMYDNRNTGLQNVFVTKPTGNYSELERTTNNELWQTKYLPVTNRIFFYLDLVNINFVNKGACNVNEVRLLYVPSMFPEAMIPDAIIDQAIQKTILSMKTAADKNVIKETLDQNKNKVLETELNTAQAKP